MTYCIFFFLFGVSHIETLQRQDFLSRKHHWDLLPPRLSSGPMPHAVHLDHLDFDLLLRNTADYSRPLLLPSNPCPTRSTTWTLDSVKEMGRVADHSDPGAHVHACNTKSGFIKILFFHFTSGGFLGRKKLV